MRFSGIATALAALGALLLLTACEERPGGRMPALGVVLVTVDTLRADRVGAYGYADAETPVLDRLAREGVLFRQASAQVPLTLPSHASLFTARDPVSHGVRDNTSFRLPESEQTLAEILAQQGYQTGAVIGAVVLNGRFGLNQGFASYDDLVVRATRQPEALQRRADEVTERALDWLASQRREPFFLWIHYFDPHEPYAAPPPLGRRFAHAPYDGEIAFVDRSLGTLVEGLRALDLEQRTLLVITSDHGEGLGEHGEETHGFFLYETTLRVPLIWWRPGLLPEGMVIEDPVRSLDIVPTVLDLLKLPPKPDAEGRSLLPLIEGSRSSLALEVYGESLAGRLAFGLSPVRSLRVGEWKYILAPREELYRLEDDPSERRDLAPRMPERAAELRRRLLERVRRAAEQEEGPGLRVSPEAELEEQLRSLGYVAHASLLEQTRRFDREPEPAGGDPKDAKALIHRLIRGELLHGLGRWEEAEAEFREVLRLHPGNEHALTYLAKLYAEQGKLDEAIALFEPLPDGPLLTRARQVLGKLHLRQGSWDRALEVFARLVEGEPHNAWGHYYMGQAYRGKGLRDQAIRSFEHAVRTEPSLAEAWGELGAARLAEGSPGKAAEAYRTALALVPDSPVFHAGLASTLQAQGRPREALAVHRKAVELDPRDPEAREELVLCLLRLGEVDAALQQASRSFPARRDSPALRVALAAGWTRRGRPEAASRTLSELLEREPRSPDAWYYLAVAQAQRGELDAALSSLERSFSLAGKPYEALARAEPAFERLLPDPRFQKLLSGSG